MTTATAALKLACPACSNTLRLPSEYAGRKGRCPRCDAAIRVPGAKRRPEAAPRARRVPTTTRGPHRDPAPIAELYAREIAEQINAGHETWEIARWLYERAGLHDTREAREAVQIVEASLKRGGLLKVGGGLALIAGGLVAGALTGGAIFYGLFAAGTALVLGGIATAASGQTSCGALEF